MRMPFAAVSSSVSLEVKQIGRLRNVGVDLKNLTHRVIWIPYVLLFVHDFDLAKFLFPQIFSFHLDGSFLSQTTAHGSGWSNAASFIITSSGSPP